MLANLYNSIHDQMNRSDFHCKIVSPKTQFTLENICIKKVKTAYAPFSVLQNYWLH